MFEGITNDVGSILTWSIGGVNIVTLLVTIVTVIVEIRKLKAANNLSKDTIEQAFKNAVLPSNIKLDVSNKIALPIKQGFAEMQVYLQDTINQVKKGEKLILSILNEFSHVNKLDDDTKQEIQEFLEAVEVTVPLE